MSKGLKLMFAVILLAAIVVPAVVSAKPGLKPEVASAIKVQLTAGPKPEAKPEG